MNDSNEKCCCAGNRLGDLIFAIAHIAALTCIATALWQIWHVLGDLVGQAG